MVSTVRYSRDPEKQREYNLEARYQEQEARRAERATHGPITPSQAHTVPHPSDTATQTGSWSPFSGAGAGAAMAQPGMAQPGAAPQTRQAPQQSWWSRLFHGGEPTGQAQPEQYAGERGIGETLAGFGKGAMDPSSVPGMAARGEPGSGLLGAVVSGPLDAIMGAGAAAKGFTKETVDATVSKVVRKAGGNPAKLMKAAKQMDQTALTSFEREVVKGLKKSGSTASKSMLTSLKQSRDKSVRKWAERMSKYGGGRSETIMKAFYTRKMSVRAALLYFFHSPLGIGAAVVGTGYAAGRIGFSLWKTKQETESLITWMAIDNMMTTESMFVRDLAKDVESGRILPADALKDIAETDEMIEAAYEFTRTAPEENFFLKPHADMIAGTAEMVEVAVNYNKKKIQDFADANELGDEDWETVYERTMAERDVVEAGIEQEKRTYYEGRRKEEREHWEKRQEETAAKEAEERAYWDAKEKRDAAKTAEERAYWEAQMKEREGAGQSRLDFGLL